MLKHLFPRKFAGSECSNPAKRVRAATARKLLFEPLEDRRLLAVLHLADLRDGGAADSQGFILTNVVPQDLTGYSVSTAGDLNGDGYDDLLIGAPVDRLVDAGSGAVYVVYGKAGGFQDLQLSPAIDTADGKWLFGLNSGDRLGYSVSAAGDINADGYHDFIIGAPYADRAVNGGTLVGTGAAYVVYGGPGAPPLLTELNGSNGFALQGLLEFDRAGFSVSTAGDVNGDGYADFLVGAPADNLSQTAGIGVTYLVFGTAEPFDAQVNLWEVVGSRGFPLFGLAADDHLGSAVSSVGDLNGDGYDDFVIGAPYADPTFGGAGSAYVIFGGPNPARGVNALNGTNGFRLDGFLPFERAGFSISSAGDFNGDGFDDLLIGAPGDRDNPWDNYDTSNPAGAGRAYVIFGKAGGFPATINLGTLDGSGNGFSVTGIDGVVTQADGVDYAGFSVSAVGDVDGDGYDDIIIGAPYADTASTSGVGEAYLIYGRPEGFQNGLSLATLTSDQGLRLVGDRFLERAGYSVSAAGDINGDGFADVIIGAPSFFPYSGVAGRSYVLFGSDFRGKQPIVGTTSGDELFGTLGADSLIGGQGNDTLWGLGGADVLIGGQGDDVLIVSDLNFRRVDGGRGYDTLRLDGSGLTLDLNTIPHNRIVGIEEIDITGTGNNHLILGSLQRVLKLSDTSHRLVVRRNTGDTVTIGSGWTELASEFINGVPFRVYQQGVARLLVQNPPPSLDLNGPSVNGNDFAAAFQEDQPPVVIVSADLTVVDDSNIVSATVRITNLLNSSDEILAVDVGTTGLNAVYNSATGVLTISGSASPSLYQQVLRTLTYRNASHGPDTTDRLITVFVNDGTSNSPLATATVTLTAVNDAPILLAVPAPALSFIDEDTTNPAGDTVSAMVGNGSIIDPDGAAVEAVAVVGLNNTHGTWQYRLADEWLDFGMVTPAMARLLGPTSSIRFVPQANYHGPATLSFRAWDQTTGVVGGEADTTTNGGTTAYSVAVVTATLIVRAVNDAPVLDGLASHVLASINENVTNSPGTAVSSLVAAGSITDVDGPHIGGIAIVNADDSHGRWEYSLNGQTWTTVTASATSSLLLSPNHRVRYVPQANFHGTVTFQFRAWDQSAGVAGGFANTTPQEGVTAFSAVVGTASLEVLEVDDLPTLHPISAVVLDVSTTSHVVNLSGISDGDDGTEELTITAVSNNHAVMPDPLVTYTSPETTGTLTLQPVSDELGSALITVTVTEADGDSFSRVFLVSIGANTTAWQNPNNRFDVDDNGFVVPLDALLIINELNNPRLRDAQGRLPLPPPGTMPPPYLDPSGDAHVTALDVLLIINFLNNRPGSGAEGEAIFTSDQDAEVGFSTAIVSPSLPVRPTANGRDVDEIVSSQTNAIIDELTDFHRSRPQAGTADSALRDRIFARMSQRQDDWLIEPKSSLAVSILSEDSDP